VTPVDGVATDCSPAAIRQAATGANPNFGTAEPKVMLCTIFRRLLVTSMRPTRSSGEMPNLPQVSDLVAEVTIAQLASLASRAATACRPAFRSLPWRQASSDQPRSGRAYQTRADWPRRWISRRCTTGWLSLDDRMTTLARAAAGSATGTAIACGNGCFVKGILSLSACNDG
jgi:hypothetical protein